MSFKPEEVKICVSAYNAAEWNRWTRDCVKELLSLGFHDYQVTRGTYLEKNRNRVVDKYDYIDARLDSRVKKYLHLDCDCEPTIKQIYKLLDYDSKQYPIVAGNYLKRGMTDEFVTVDLQGRQYKHANIPDGIHEVKAIGFGCAVVSADVYKTIPKPWFECHYAADPDGKLHYLSEDFMFCGKAFQKGFKVYVDFDVEVIHRTETAAESALDFQL